MSLKYSSIVWQAINIWFSPQRFSKEQRTYVGFAPISILLSFNRNPLFVLRILARISHLRSISRDGERDPEHLPMPLQLRVLTPKRVTSSICIRVLSNEHLHHKLVPKPSLDLA
ncbi:hypothetical protein NM688_g3732 [Phlebia brevispora]|uniref:Uncharacterized protein n=1 Tax=Phlebia brevispora TaxID=194682 RepID=A0ACC1T4P8_9APHY|nr:hypothetical protein NM688_g3732 [Phlebia brevispora]